MEASMPLTRKSPKPICNGRCLRSTVEIVKNEARLMEAGREIPLAVATPFTLRRTLGQDRWLGYG